MHPDRDDTLTAELIALAAKSNWLRPALVAVRELGLPSWCIGAGAIRNLVWDRLHGFDDPSALADIDVAYFDASDMSIDRDRQLECRLAAAYPALAWDVKNQAGVHLWYESKFGQAVAPFESLQEAVASWPEVATSVGLTLRADDSIEVIAPHGLGDLFAMVVRHNPTRVGVETFRKRVQEKRYQTRWPRVIVISA
ncbi:nucleotidyltransferase family protein [Trinickia sp. NRRL B-1857]|uniref:nucleotidyltransferase family protein n=1 Tax=Trinickia sp. NRRL B-1857 TaxID=3162879 RepID=UPI003D26E98F